MVETRVMGKSVRVKQMMGTSKETDRRMMGKSERQANDGEEQETVRQMMGKSERQASDGEERER